MYIWIRENENGRASERRKENPEELSRRFLSEKEKGKRRKMIYTL